MTALESSHDPFQIPYFLHISRTITCRVSEFGSEFFVRSTRTSILDDDSVFEEIRRLSAMEQPNVARKPLPPRPPHPRKSSIIGEFPMERPPPMAQKPRARGWGEEWTHLVQDTSTESMPRTYSSASVSDSSSSTSISDRSSDASVSKRVPRPRNVTPSSSISNMSRRSPLSTMRYALNGEWLWCLLTYPQIHRIPRCPHSSPAAISSAFDRSAARMELLQDCFFDTTTSRG